MFRTMLLFIATIVSFVFIVVSFICIFWLGITTLSVFIKIVMPILLLLLIVGFITSVIDPE